MTPRLAQRRDVNGGMYLVAKTCPHALPAGAEFYACACGFSAHQGVAVVACEFARASEIVPANPDNDNGDRLVICRHGDAPEPSGAQFGIPTVRHVGDVGDVSDGGDPD